MSYSCLACYWFVSLIMCMHAWSISLQLMRAAIPRFSLESRTFFPFMIKTLVPCIQTTVWMSIQYPVSVLLYCLIATKLSSSSQPVWHALIGDNANTLIALYHLSFDISVKSSNQCQCRKMYAKPNSALDNEQLCVYTLVETIRNHTYHFFQFRLLIRVDI